MAEKIKEKKVFRLKTVDEISDGYDWVFNKQVNGEIDNKTADSMNTTLKGKTYLNVKLRMDYLKMILQAKIKKVDLPQGILPELEHTQLS